MSHPQSHALEENSGPCTECRRHKMKCDKKIPCGTCVRRGCSAICPTGISLSTGRGKRSVVSDVAQLNTVIMTMGDRIRKLENALAATTEFSLPGSRLPIGADNGDALGSFSVNEDGDGVYFFGPMAGSEALFSTFGAPGAQSSEGLTSSSTPDIGPFKILTESFPFSPHPTPNWNVRSALQQVYAHLPSANRAWALCEIYYRNASWSGMPVLQSDAVELLRTVYHPPASGSESGLSTQQIAVLYLIFAFGSLVDLALPADSYDAEHYFDLARAALAIRSVLDESTVVTVQALTLLALYYAHGGRRFSMDAAWSTISLASTISQSLGLHRDSFTSKLSPQVANRYRTLFWETFTVETHSGLSVGRPTGLSLSLITCPFPVDDAEDLHPFVKILPGYYRARWALMQDVTACVREAFVQTAKPSYDTILDIDRKIRKHLHSATAIQSLPAGEGEGAESLAVYMQRHWIPMYAQSLLMYTHSSAFVEALRDTPADPGSSAYSASYFAGYRTACEVIRFNVRNFATHPGLFDRWWGVWKGLCCAAVLVGTVAIRYPSSPQALHAMDELRAAVELIEHGAVSSSRARSWLPILQQLQRKAMAVHSQYTSMPPAASTPLPGATDGETPYLEIFAGYTGVIAKKAVPQTPLLPQLESQSDPGWLGSVPNLPSAHFGVDAADFDPGLFFAHPPDSAMDVFAGFRFQSSPPDFEAQGMAWM
ncbi:fungal-specific transcription factor domain-containing protein [Mycena filopes]|nr:fungal-specific transcription factor domain-containing protein [Mycena filopes]